MPLYRKTSTAKSASSIGKVCDIDEAMADSSDVDTVSSQVHMHNWIFLLCKKSVVLQSPNLDSVPLISFKDWSIPPNYKPAETMHNTILTKLPPVLPNLK